MESSNALFALYGGTKKTNTLLLMFSEVGTGGLFLLRKMCKNSKSQIVIKLKNTNCDKAITSNRDKTKKNVLGLISNSTKKTKVQTVTKSKISNCDKTQQHK